MQIPDPDPNAPALPGVKVRNSVFWGNTPGRGGGGFALE
jgi:hypothetical protein